LKKYNEEEKGGYLPKGIYNCDDGREREGNCEVGKDGEIGKLNLQKLVKPNIIDKYGILINKNKIIKSNRRNIYSNPNIDL
jgi:hypothetical protein